jgi:threonine dehydrogenase-like Zn-dependent dehydrogenase
MRAVVVRPEAHALELVEVPEPTLQSETSVLARVLEVGLCGTDREIAAFEYGTPPDGEDQLVLGHESVVEVVEAGDGVDGLSPGDLVIPMVRRPCTVATCSPCRRGRADYCTTGEYVERGIQGAHGFLTERIVEDQRWLRPVPRELRDLAVLVEPLTIAEKGLAQLRAVQQRLGADDGPGTAVVLGAGPVGVLGAMALAVEGYDTTLYNRSAAPNEKSDLARRLGIPYVASSETSVDELRERTGPVDVIYEAAGVASAAFDLLGVLGRNGVCILTGVARPEPPAPHRLDTLVRRLVLGNQVVLGTVNASAGDFDAAIAHLGAFRDRWGDAVGALITGRHEIDATPDLLRGRAQGIKDVVAVGG